MPLNAEALAARLEETLGDKLVGQTVALGEVTIEVAPEDWIELCSRAR
jgi:hypothetical protein